MTKPVLRLPANTRGRDFVVGDIHGTFYVLEQALAAVGFDPARDRVICVGDLIDRDHAYAVDGDVYFRVRSLPEYGSLSGRDIEQMDQGEGVEGADR
jgi:hypothetical protein